MTTKTYNLYYDDIPFAEVTIDDQPQTLQYLNEMVEFWMGWENRLDKCNGDYAQCWLEEFARYVLSRRELPKDEEGWYPLDGTCGITVTWFQPPEIDDDLIEIGTTL